MQLVLHLNDYDKVLEWFNNTIMENTIKLSGYGRLVNLKFCWDNKIIVSTVSGK